MTSCPHTPQVLARHLDGDVALPFACDLSPFELREHLSECAPCQRDLQRARRLDAALAATAGLQLDAAGRGSLEALLQRAVERVEAERRPTPLPWRPPFALRLWTAAAGVAMAFALSQWWLRPAAVAADTARAAPAAAPTVASAPVPAVTPLLTAMAATPTPRLTARQPRKHTDITVLRPARTQTEVQMLGELLARGVEPARTTADGPRSRFADAVELRLQAGSFLLDGGRADAADVWIAAVAGLDAGPLLQGLLADGRRRPQLLQRLGTLLRRGSNDGAMAMSLRLAAAARLGGAGLDNTIAWLLRREPILVDSLAAALRVAMPRPQRAELLLAVWGDLVARGDVADDDATAVRLFAQQPQSTTGELLARLDSAPGPERRRACLALGVLGDAQAQDRLVQAIAAASRDEAVAAAWALGHLPIAAVAALQASADGDPSTWLLRAALTQAGAPVSKRWLAELDLTAAERALIGGGQLSLQQFATTAPLFRERLHQGQ